MLRLVGVRRVQPRSTRALQRVDDESFGGEIGGGILRAGEAGGSALSVVVGFEFQVVGVVTFGFGFVPKLFVDLMQVVMRGDVFAVDHKRLLKRGGRFLKQEIPFGITLDTDGFRQIEQRLAKQIDDLVVAAEIEVPFDHLRCPLFEDRSEIGLGFLQSSLLAVHTAAEPLQSPAWRGGIVFRRSMSSSSLQRFDRFADAPLAFQHSGEIQRTVEAAELLDLGERLFGLDQLSLGVAAPLAFHGRHRNAAPAPNNNPLERVNVDRYNRLMRSEVKALEAASHHVSTITQAETARTDRPISLSPRLRRVSSTKTSGHIRYHCSSTARLHR